MTTTLLIPQSERLLLDESDPGRVIYTGLQFDLTQHRVPGSRDVVIRAHSVTIAGRVFNPGRNIEIFAQEIRCESEAKIEVSGRNGSPDFTGGPRAKDGQNAGENGSRGEPGGRGEDAGSIYLVADHIVGQLALIADGGSGGRGQDGGHGRKGRRGRNGTSDNCNTVHAENGGRGGSGGVAGRPGDGGAGGRILVQLAQAAVDGQITISVRGGSPGASGSHGDAGEGGEPGSPSSHSYTVTWSP